MAIDVKRPLDSVQYTSVMEGAFQRGIRGRTLKFVIAFLPSSTYRIRVGNTLSPNCTNNIGVPQDSVLSLMLLNLVHQGLPARLAQLPHLGCTICAGDITI